MTGTEIVRVESRMPTRDEVNDLATLANHLAKSGRFPDAHTGYQALAKLLFGRDLGLSATAAMTGVHIIEGKPEMSANVQAQMVKTYIGPEGERYDYRILEHTGEKCRIEFSRRRDGEWQTLGVSEYTLEDARRAQLAGKGNWQKHPRNMLFARAMSDGVAFHCPEVTNGIRTYHEGEIDVDGRLRAAAERPALVQPHEVDVPLEGEVVEAEVVGSEAAAGSNGSGSTATARVPLPKALVEELVAAKKAAGVPEEWVRQQLIAIGLEDVPAGRVSLKTIRALTEQQASSLMDVLTEAQERTETALR